MSSACACAMIAADAKRYSSLITHHSSLITLTMQLVDLAIIAAYLFAVIGAGAWFGKRQSSTNRCFLAGQNVPWWAISASIVATETSTITFISVPGIAYARGGNFTFLQLVFGYLVGRIVISIVFMPAYFKGSLVTVYELLQERFGAKVKALAASLFVIMRSIADGIRLLLTAIVLGAVYRAFSPGANVAGVIGGCFLTMSTHGTDQYLVQRYLCTNSAREASKALLASGVVILAQFIGFLFIGVLLFAFYRPDLTGYMVPDQVFPDFITRHLPSR